MIKIIKKGNLKVVECKNCGCVFSYENEDIFSRTTKYGNEYQIYKIKNTEYIKECPQCFKEVILEEKTY